jgi:predicted Zn-dependent protease
MIAFWLCLGVLSAPGARIVASVRRPIVLSIAVSAVIFGAGAVLVSGLTLASDYNVAVAKSQQSLSAADAAVQLAPWYYSARVEQAYETGLQAVLATQQKSADAAVRVKTAEDTMGRLVAFNPQALTGYDLQSAFLLEIGSSQNDTTVLERAVSAAEGGLKIQPTSISLATRKAQALAALGRNDQAATVMSAAWELYPGDPAPGVLYAQLLLDAGKAQDAKRVSATLTTRFPAEASVRQLAAQTQAPGAQ